MAPEMCANCGYSYSVDIWSFGLLAFRLLTSESFYSSNDLNDGFEMKMLDWRVKETDFLDKVLLPKLDKTNLDVTAKQFLMSCLRADETKRSSAEELLNDVFLNS